MTTMRRAGSLVVLIVLAALLAPVGARAATYLVGPTRTYTQPSQVADLLQPGDVVLIDGSATYQSVHFEQDGTAAEPITIRGVVVNGNRPVISGGVNTIEAQGDHYLFEGLDLTGGTSRCFFHHADDITVQSTVVHDCPRHGFLGADNDSGDLTLRYVEVHHTGQGTQYHQIYIATDEIAHPGSVFRLEHSYIHDANGGNNIKSRAERNEIYYNWIEGAVYHELELLGPDPAGGVPENQAREDSDIVGNVLIKRATTYVTRFGGDGTGQSNGRYRFAFNTVVTQPGGSAVFRLFDGLDSVEADGNVLHAAGAGYVVAERDLEADWVSGRAVAGRNNWVKTGTGSIPPEWTGTLTGSDPGFTNFSANDLRPATGSPLLDAGPSGTASPAGHPFPNPLHPPAFHPPARQLEALGQAAARPVDAPIDIGAFERPGTPGSSHTLTVARAGTGSGSVAGDGITCPDDCTNDYGEGAGVTLSASPAVGSVFAGWSGDCSGTGNCVVTMNDDRTVTATFNTAAGTTHTLTVTRSGSGSGSVEGPGIACPTDCTHEYDSGAVVTLTTTVHSGSAFAGWSGDCSGTGNCVLTVNGDRTVNATFNPAGSGYRPDIAVRSSAAFIGEDFYNTTGKGQVAKLTVRQPATATYTFRISNDGGVADYYQLSGCNERRGYIAEIADGSGDVTEEIQQGAYQTPVLAPGQSIELALEVHTSRRASDSKWACRISVESYYDPGQIDVGRAKTTVR